MAAWNSSTQAGAVYQNQSARYLSDEALEEFAMKVYTKMGYQARRTGQTGDHGVDVRLINPEKQIELVQCKQWRKSVGEPQVRDLYGAMAHAKAVRGWLWAPNGFSEPAKRWAKGKPIVLVDDEEIGRLIESAYGDS
jgi:restriction system protein